MISANLIGKCLLIGGAGAATGTGAYYIKETYFSNNKELKDLAEKVGLSCVGKPTETFGVECKKIDGKNINLKQGSSDAFEATAISGGKITVYTTSSKQEYDKGFKFVIEDADVSATTAAASGGSSTTKKLEQFETYEIKDENNDKNWKLRRKNDAKTEIKKALGLPSEGTDCDLPTASSSEKTCTLDEGKLKAINFEGKSPSGLTLENNDSPSLSLKMKVVTASDEEKDIFPHGYKFELQSNKDITLDTSKVIKKGTNTEFKIKVTSASENAPKVLTLEKAWSVVELGKKVGLECLEGDKKECTLGDKINVNNNGSANETTKKHAELTKKADTGNKVVKYEFDQDGHSQGIKFFTEETNGIELENGTGGSDTNSKKIEGKSGDAGTFYEIKKDTDGKWYLTKKTTPS